MSDKITIRLHVHKEDGDFYFKKPAPKLPECLTWHENLMVELVKNEEWLIVDHVILNLDGSVDVVVLFKMPGSGWGAMAKSSWWESRGWIPTKKR